MAVKEGIQPSSRDWMAPLTWELVPEEATLRYRAARVWEGAAMGGTRPWGAQVRERPPAAWRPLQGGPPVLGKLGQLGALGRVVAGDAGPQTEAVGVVVPAGVAVRGVAPEAEGGRVSP